MLGHPPCVIPAAVVITCSGLCEEGVEGLPSVTACLCAGPQRVSGWLRHVLRLHADQLLPRLCSQTTPVISLAAKSTLLPCLVLFDFVAFSYNLYVYVVTYNYYINYCLHLRCFVQSRTTQWAVIVRAVLKVCSDD